MKLKLNDTVTWTSNDVTKTGKVVRILAPKEPLIKSECEALGNCAKLTMFRYKCVNGVAQNQRDHESYLVLVPSKTGKGKGMLFHPKTCLLNKTGK